MRKRETDQPIIIKQPTAGRLAGIFATFLIGALAVFLLFASIILILKGELLSILISICAVIMLVLFRYVLRDTRGKSGWRITISADALDLDLPRGRSLIHRLEPVHARLLLDDIEMVETRLEAYPSFGAVAVHRSYALKLKKGELIILGEDRAQNTGYASSKLAEAIDKIVRHGKFGAHQLGMVEGRGGIFMVLFASAPPWDTPSLSVERQEVLWRAAGITGSLAKSAALVTLLNTHSK